MSRQLMILLNVRCETEDLCYLCLLEAVYIVEMSNVYDMWDSDKEFVITIDTWHVQLSCPLAQTQHSVSRNIITKRCVSSNPM